MQLIHPEEVVGLAFAADDPIDPDNVREMRIEAAQLRYIRPTFGDAMYESMRRERYPEFVYTFIKPALAHFVRYELIVELAVRSSGRGVGRPSVEETTQTSSATRNDIGSRKEDVNSERDRASSQVRETADTETRKVTDKKNDTTTTEAARAQEETVQKSSDVSATDQTTDQSSVTKQGETSATEEVAVTEETGSKKLTTTRKTTDTTTTGSEESTNTVRTAVANDTQDTTRTLSGSGTTTDEQTDVEIRNAQVATTARSENEGSGTTNRSGFRAATAEEWQLLSRQALRDARTFLRYAVEHVEEHPEDFPDYAPKSGLGSVGVRRCIGGIIL
ncbi:hypothetical protein [uncultured Rikenella sp.]|uniref:DUF6712 family protein n=1 Tax=uncultured Rikenella sp. TaxID=368003 RepID=UPI0025CBA2CC|nr:hypothetical protein [uncultured Rikenella sp.]